uniref:Uncharacterized protein n=1 Tax=Fagus sylvatica TaxID=28930 RepID=A0A2N9I3M8_FAGSY
MSMAEKCHTSTTLNDALVRPPLNTHKPTTCEDALIRPIQGCDTPPTYKEALIRPPPMNISQQLDTDSYDMDCEETVPIKEDENIYVGRPQYLRDEKKQAEKEEIEKEKTYEITRVLIGKKPKKKNQAKPEKPTDEAVSEAKDELFEVEQIEAVDMSNTKVEEDYQEDEDDDSEEFALSIGAIREEEHTQTESMQEDDQETNTNTVDCNMVYVLPREFMSLERLVDL